MAYYQELSSIVDNIIGEKMLRNQNLCKLVYYYPTTGSRKGKNFNDLDFPVFNQPDLQASESNKLYLTHIYPLPKMPDAKIEQKCYVCVTLAGGYEPEQNSGFRRVNLMVDIICHLDSWKVREGYRPYLIMHEVDKMLNNQVTDLPIENRPFLRGFQPRDYSNYYYGYQLLYELYVNSNVTCNPESSLLGTQDTTPTIETNNYFMPKNIGRTSKNKQT